MKGGETIKMRGGGAIMLGLFAVALAIIVHVLGLRYQVTATGPGSVVRIDRMRGQVCFYNFEKSSFTNCTPEDDYLAD